MNIINKSKAFVSVFLILAMLLPSLAVSANSQSEIDAQKNAIESKYNISIKYETKDDTSAASARVLATLDSALSNVTPSVVKQVSSYYEKKVGNKLTFSFKFTSSDQKYDDNLEILGLFNKEKALIEVYVPTQSKGTYISGDNPITILHEFAHAYFIMFIDYYGQDKMEKEWITLNDGTTYNEGFLAYAYNKVTFMSSYGATSLTEDFAEIFSNAFLRKHAGQGFSHRLLNGDRKTSLGKKVDFIEKMLPTYLTDTSTAVSNLHRAFTTSSSLYYQDVKLSGDKLMYIGYNSPKYVLNGILNFYSLKGESSTWIPEIGGWQVKSTDSKYYLVFPGGYCEMLSKPFKVS